jgi:hypothetical protein
MTFDQLGPCDAWIRRSRTKPSSARLWNSSGRLPEGDREQGGSRQTALETARPARLSAMGDESPRRAGTSSGGQRLKPSTNGLVGIGRLSALADRLKLGAWNPPCLSSLHRESARFPFTGRLRPASAPHSWCCSRVDHPLGALRFQPGTWEPVVTSPPGTRLFYWPSTWSPRRRAFAASRLICRRTSTRPRGSFCSSPPRPPVSGFIWESIYKRGRRFWICALILMDIPAGAARDSPSPPRRPWERA